MKIANFEPKNKSGLYDFWIIPNSFDEVCISVQNVLYENGTIKQYVFPIKKASGFSWKCNTQSISCDSGKATDIIKLFELFPAYAKATVQKLVFDNPKTNKIGL